MGEWSPNNEMGDQSKSDISGRVRDEWSPTMGPGPKSTMLIVQVKRSINMSPKAGCLNRQADIIEDPLTSYWSWSLASLAGMPMTVDGRWLSPDSSPNRVWAISANLGGEERGSQ